MRPACCASGPSLMTTMAALLGALPLALGTGVGAELRRPLGITIIGGLIVSQLLTLYTTPVVYLFLDRLQVRLGGTRAVHPADRAARLGGVRERKRHVHHNRALQPAGSRTLALAGSVNADAVPKLTG